MEQNELEACQLTKTKVKKKSVMFCWFSENYNSTVLNGQLKKKKWLIYVWYALVLWNKAKINPDLVVENKRSRQF